MMKKTTKVLAAMLAFLAGLSANAAHDAVYYDRNGATASSGVTYGANYIWNTNVAMWNSAANGSGSFTNWNDVASDANAWRAYFSAGAPGVSYTVTVPNGERRVFQYLCANKDSVTFTGGGSFSSNNGRLQPFNLAWDTKIIAVNPATLTLSNIVMDMDTSALFVGFQGADYAGLIKIGSGVAVGYKQWSVENYGTLDLGALLDKNLIFTTDYPFGGRFAHLFINGGDNNVIQGSGLFTIPLASWYYGPFPSFSWNAGGGGFAGRGGKLTVNFFSDGRTLTWGVAPFVPSGSVLVLGSYYADSEVEFQNGIDLNGNMRRVRVLSPLFTGASGSFATISGVISDSAGGGGIIKDAQAGQAAATLVLSGANAYSGATKVDEGKLVVTSAHQGGGTVDVADNATLGVRVTSTATVPMSSLTLGSAGASTLEINYCTPSPTAPVTAARFTASGTTATINVGGRLQAGQFPLVKYTGSIGGNGFAGLALGTLPAGVSATLVDNSGNQSVDLNVTVAPAVATPAMVNLAVSGGNVRFTATNGLPDCGCAVLSSANLATPVAGWTPVSTHTFGPNGSFPFSTSGNSAAEQFYNLLSAAAPGFSAGPAELKLVGNWSVEVKVSDTNPPPHQITTTLSVAPPTTITVSNELHSPLTGWTTGLPGWAQPGLLRIQDGTNTGLGALIAGSVQVTSTNVPHLQFTAGTDFNVDYQWGAVGRVAGGGIGAAQAVFVNYQFMQRRLDSIVLTPAGGLVLRPGVAHISTAQPPALLAGEQRIANIWVPAQLAKLTADNLFPILETSYPEPAKTSPTTAERWLPNTMAKLTNGQPLKILAWGDSVTAGPFGVIQWQAQLVSRLSARFPNANIQLTTLGWGAHTSTDFLNDTIPGDVCNYQEKVVAPAYDLVISEFLNDANLDVATVQMNYNQFHGDFQGIGTEWLILTPNYSIFMNYTSELNLDADPRPYVDMIRQFATAHNVPLGDAAARYGRLWRQGLPFTTMMVNIANHPDSRGMAIFADSLMALFP